MINKISAYEYNGELFIDLDEAVRAKQRDMLDEIIQTEQYDKLNEIFDLLLFDMHMNPQSIKDVIQNGPEETFYCYVGDMFSLNFLQTIFCEWIGYYIKDFPITTTGFWHYDAETYTWYEYYQQISDLKYEFNKLEEKVKEENMKQ